MRAVVIVIVALLAGGCAASRNLDLVSRDPQSPWEEGHRWVRTESSVATVTMSFDRIWDDYLDFQAEVVNHSDSTLRVDPEQFSFTLASSGDELPAKLKQSFPATAPDAALARLDRQIKSQARVGPLTEMVAGLVVLAAMAVEAVEFGDMSLSVDKTDGSSCIQPQPTTTESAAFEPEAQPRVTQKIRDRNAKALLRATDLAPGATVRGEIWMPAWPVRKAAGPEEPTDDQSITAPKKHVPAFHDLTVRVPAAVGGQEFEYSIVDADETE